MEDLDIHLLTGTVSIEKLEIKEKSSDEIWLECSEIEAGIHTGKLITGSYVSPRILINGLKTTVVQRGNHFNFDDLLQLPEKYSSGEQHPTEDSEPTEWVLNNVELRNSEIRYLSPDYGIDYTAGSINISTPQLAWDKSKMSFSYGFSISTGGQLEGQYAIDVNNLDYELSLISHQLNLNAAKPYVDEFFSFKDFQGAFESNLDIRGNHQHPEALDLSGTIALRDLECLDPSNQKIASLQSFEIEIDSIQIATNYFDFGEILIDSPQLLFELYPDGDNWSRLMQTSDSTSVSIDSASAYSNPFVMLAQYLRTYIKDYIVSDYYADNIILESGQIKYSDFTLHEPFICEMDQMRLFVDRVNTDLERLKLNFSSSINKQGLFETNIAINPRDYQDMECEFDLTALSATTFNPYMTYYVATPFTSGEINFSNQTTIESGILHATNALFVRDPKTGAKVKNTTSMKLPVKLAVSLLRNVDGNIDLEIPVEGDLNDPEYKLRKAIWSIVKNLLLKAVEAPGKLLAKIGGDKEENLQDILITYGHTGFSKDQLVAIEKMSLPLINKPELHILFTQATDFEEELNTLALLDARKQFCFDTGMQQPSIEVSDEFFDKLSEISIQDSSFVAWLNKKSQTENQILSTLDKCKKITDESSLKQMLNETHAGRMTLLRDQLIKHGVASNRIQFNSTEITDLNPGELAKFKYEISVDENSPE